MANDKIHDLEQALAGARRGDTRSWSRIVSAHERLVYAVARRAGLPEEDAADVFQHTFLALYRNLDRIESPHVLPQWLAKTAAREAYRILRINRRTSDVEPSLLDEVVADEEANAETLATDASQAHYLKQMVAGLKGRCAELLDVLFFRGEEVDYEDVARRLGIPIGSIGPTRARCLEKLRKELAHAGFFDDVVSQAVPERLGSAI